MVTGDQHAIAVETSRRLGLGTEIMEGKDLVRFSPGHKGFLQKVTEVDGFAGVFPEHKHRIVEALQASGRLVGMTGEPASHLHFLLPYPPFRNIAGQPLLRRLSCSPP